MADERRSFLSGTKVLYSHPLNGDKNDQAKAGDCLDQNAQYTVQKIEFFNWKTYLYFKEIPLEKFNSVMFEIVEE